MRYDLESLASLCSKLKMEYERQDTNHLHVHLAPDCCLEFSNQPEEDDTMVGFLGTPWHGHDRLMLMTGESTFIEYDELDIVRGLSSGELVIISQFMNGQRNDRWLAHKNEKLDIKHIEAGEELQVRRMA